MKYEFILAVKKLCSDFNYEKIYVVVVDASDKLECITNFENDEIEMLREVVNEDNKFYGVN